MVPICFALDGDRVYSAVDEKPKSTRRLRRLANVEATGRASLVVDEYDEDWARLWWVRADGAARVAADPDEVDAAVALLAAKYAQYRERPPRGPALVVTVERVVSWSATPP